MVLVMVKAALRRLRGEVSGAGYRDTPGHTGKSRIVLVPEIYKLHPQFPGSIVGAVR